MSFNLITILGPTAVGKTKLAAEIAFELNGEIISADSRQVYRKLNIGTGKDYEDYIVNDTPIPVHLIDIIDLPEEYNLFDFYKSFFHIYKSIKSRNKTPILCGGSGLYLSAVIQNYDLKEVENNESIENELKSKSFDELKEIYFSLVKKPHNKTDLTSKSRLIKAIVIEKSEKVIEGKIHINSLNIGINPGREIVRQRIKTRLEKRLKEGMIEEVAQLIEDGIEPDRLIKLGLEYKFITEYLTGKYTKDEMTEKLYYAICAFAKRQMTWFRKMEREGVNIFWLENADKNSAFEIIKQHYVFE
ncbi:MAG: tRNA (adenosine(37)-N6)-dimethylallyltransferase MiaA [Ignavibacterium sp.]|nr:tRNA (adenosine(37)-N6)-dimethylallyltransferase MiaA [Ignavibacterium sp.]MDW8375984.1 tRNA (adenosine(37)-N6)-dimethylallyltransferase MiaA [Ignavibacteriales bacterium]